MCLQAEKCQWLLATTRSWERDMEWIVSQSPQCNNSQTVPLAFWHPHLLPSPATVACFQGWVSAERRTWSWEGHKNQERDSETWSFKPLGTCRNPGVVAEPAPDMELGTQSTGGYWGHLADSHTVSLCPLCWGHYLHSQAGSRGSVRSKSSHGIWTQNFLLHSKYSSSTSTHWLIYFPSPTLLFACLDFSLFPSAPAYPVRSSLNLILSVSVFPKHFSWNRPARALLNTT